MEADLDLSLGRLNQLSTRLRILRAQARWQREATSTVTELLAAAADLETLAAERMRQLASLHAVKRRVRRSVPAGTVEALAKCLPQEDDVCVICLARASEQHEEDDAVVLPCSCKSPYHRKCIGEWLSLNCTCPICRFEMPFEEWVEEDETNDGELLAFAESAYIDGLLGNSRLLNSILSVHSESTTTMSAVVAISEAMAAHEAQVDLVDLSTDDDDGPESTWWSSAEEPMEVSREDEEEAADDADEQSFAPIRAAIAASDADTTDAPLTREVEERREDTSSFLARTEVARRRATALVARSTAVANALSLLAAATPRTPLQTVRALARHNSSDEDTAPSSLSRSSIDEDSAPSSLALHSSSIDEGSAPSSLARQSSIIDEDPAPSPDEETAPSSPAAAARELSLIHSSSIDEDPAPSSPAAARELSLIHSSSSDENSAPSSARSPSGSGTAAARLLLNTTTT